MTGKHPPRRLAALLAADVVGYSRLIETDDVRTLTALKLRRREILMPLVVQNHGRVVNFTGDGVLVEFGSAVDAVQCAVKLQERFAEANLNFPADQHIILRIGINLGDIIVEGQLIYGDGVNVAARIESLAEPGSIWISATVYELVHGKLALKFDDLGEHALKNIAKRVRIYRATPATQSQNSTSLPPALPDKPSIAVLPFTNMSTDPEQDYFADGLTEDLITDLSKVSGLFVIARHSTFAYKGKSFDIRQAARELGVGLITEGSVRRSASRVRVTVQLIDASDGKHIWADRFDRDIEDVFAVQDEIVGKIVAALANVLPVFNAPAKRREPKIAAYDLFVKGRAQSLHLATANHAARLLLEEACRTDPEFSEAHAWLAMNLHYGWMYCYEEDARDTALALAVRAVSLDQQNADAHVILGYLQIFGNQPDLDSGRKQFMTALEINSNHADAWMFLADLETLEGNIEAALKAGYTAFRLNPRPPSYYHWLFCWVLYAAKRYEEVVDLARRDSEESLGSQRLLAAALAQLGRTEEAREAAQKFMSKMPNFTVSSWVNTLPVKNPLQLDDFVQGYLKAGIPA